MILPMLIRVIALASLCVLAGCAGCAASRPGTVAYQRQGDEIMACGQLVHTGAPVVLWTDPGGYDAYRVEKRFGPLEKSSWEAMQKEGRGPETPNRYNTRFFRFAEKQPEFTGSPALTPLTPDEIARVRGGGWDLPALQRVVDQFVIHYDVCGTSRQCFRVLHDLRGLSVHFMLDIDGTIYQTLDLKERAWHASSSNDRSVGIEIANIGAYPPGETALLDKWYLRDKGGYSLNIPHEMGDGGIRTPNFVARPARPDPVIGEVQGRTLRQFDLTPQQYASLVKLTAALCTLFPNLPCDYPRDESGNLITRKLSDQQLTAHRGLIGHYHIAPEKIDPGPAFQWDLVVNGARRELGRTVPAPTAAAADWTR